MKTDLVQSLLIDVRERGAANIEKRKLLWMLGRSNDTVSAWRDLLREWKEVCSGELYGHEWGLFITLSARTNESVEEKWTK